MVKPLKSSKTKFQDHHSATTSEPLSHHSQLLLDIAQCPWPRLRITVRAILPSPHPPYPLQHFITLQTRPRIAFLRLSSRAALFLNLSKRQKGFRRLYESPKYSPNRPPLTDRDPTDRPTTATISVTTYGPAPVPRPTASRTLVSYVRPLPTIYLKSRKLSRCPIIRSIISCH